MAQKTTLKNRLKEIKKQLDNLEEEQFHRDCDKCEEIAVEMYSLINEAEDIKEQLKKKK